ncbi:MAG: aminoacetone oxidase family FAD-binding enzyme [Planctomycetaceae bacterium]|nr:aminoacetone oxidase family FAD-binding enzyme [Planctomycetaceae bacterium]
MRHKYKKQLQLHHEAVVDVAIVGAGAAGLFAAIWAGKKVEGHSVQIAVFDSARKLGAKILVAGGGRCNVTHCRVTEHDFAGSSPAAIRKVLRRFSVEQTVQFFADAGIELKKEETGKLFPVSDSARTILQALLDQAQSVDVSITHPARVTDIDQLPCSVLTKGCEKEPRLRVVSEDGVLLARHVIVCTGGKSLPKSGSDGSGYRLVEKLGHTISKPLVPALVPLTLADSHWIRGLSGVTVPAAVTLSKESGKRICTYSGSTLCTHLGLSGPSILDISRHWLIEQDADSNVRLNINWLPEHSENVLDDLLQDQRIGAFGVLRRWLPDRLARQLCIESGATCTGDLTRSIRKKLVKSVTATPLPVQGNRGFAVAEATAGGVPLEEVQLETMESRKCPGLYLAGEVLDVDGRIGGFNFQWAWSSGFVAGSAVAKSATEGSN